MLKTISVWQNTKTFFPLFLDVLKNNIKENLTICVVGASDGRFVLPIAECGFDVLAIENDTILISGGKIEDGNHGKINIIGLEERLRIEVLGNRVKIIKNNFLDIKSKLTADAIFTSSTWDCTINHTRPLKEYINKMQSIVKKDGFFCAEYMMPCEKKHSKIEHFLKERDINKFFKPTEWLILEEFFTPVFKDKPHIGKQIPHNHRMGFFLAKKLI